MNRLAAVIALAALSTACPLQVPLDSVDNRVANLTLGSAAGSIPDHGTQPLALGGAPLVITASATDANGQPVAGFTLVASAQQSGNVVSLSQAGGTLTITPTGPGTAVITVTAGSRTITFTVVVSAQAQSLVITGGVDPFALGSPDAVFTAVADPGIDTSAAVWSLGDGNLLRVAGGGVSATGKQVTLHAAGPGFAHVQVSFGGRSAQKIIHVTATSIAVSPASASVIVNTNTTFTATVTGQGGAVGTTNRVDWNVSTGSAACSIVGSATGGAVSVLASAAGTCLVAASVDGLLSNAVTLTSIAVGGIAVSGSSKGNLVVRGATSSYTATVVDKNGQTIAGAQVAWSTDNPAVVTITQAGVATPVGIGTANVQASLGGVTRQSPVTVAPASVAFAQTSVPAATGNSAVLLLQGMDAQGAVAPIGSPVSVGASQSDVIFTSTPAFASVGFGPANIARGNAVNIPVIAGASAQDYAVSASFFGVSGATAVVHAAVPTVSLAFTGGPATSVRIPAGNAISVTSSVTVGSAPVGATVNYVASGDNILSGKLTTGTGAASFTVTGIGTATLTAAAGGSAASNALTLTGLAVSARLSANGALLSAQNHGAVALGSALAVAVAPADSNGAAVLPFFAGTLSLTSGNTGIATVSCSAQSQQTGLACNVSGVAAGSTTLNASWTDGTTTVSASAPLDVTAAAAPSWASGATFAAVWSAPTRFDLTFSPAQASGNASPLAYKLYASSSAAAATDLTALHNGTSVTLTTSGSNPLTAAVSSLPYSSRYSLGIAAQYANSAESALQRVSITVPAFSGAASVPFLAGRTAFSVDTAGDNIQPIAIVGQDYPFAVERTAPRLSVASAAQALVGITGFSGGERLYSRPLGATALSVPTSGTPVDTDQVSGGCTAEPLRPTTAFDAFGPSTQLGHVFTVTTSVGPCNKATLVFAGASASSGSVVSDEVEQVALAGDHGVVILRKGAVSLIDLTDPSFAERPVAAAPAGSIIAALPAGGASGNPSTAFVYNGTQGLMSYPLAPIANGAQVIPPLSFAAGQTPIRATAISSTLFVLEVNDNGAHELWKLDTAALPQTRLVAPADVGGDNATLGSSYDTGF